MRARSLARGSALCWGMALALFPSLGEARGPIPVPGITPDKSGTIGPVVGVELGEPRLVLAVEGSLARKNLWASFSGRVLLGGEQPAPGLAVDLGVNLTIVNVGLGYQLRQDGTFLHGPSLWLGGVVPVADIQKDGFRLFGFMPFLEPYYRLTFFFGEEGGAANEFGLGFRLWRPRSF